MQYVDEIVLHPAVLLIDDFHGCTDVIRVDGEQRREYVGRDADLLQLRGGLCVACGVVAVRLEVIGDYRCAIDAQGG